MKKNIHPLSLSIHTRLRAFHLKRLLPGSGHGVFLDVGCGLGYLTGVLGGKYDKCIGLEYDRAALQSEFAHKRTFPVVGSAFELPLKEKSVDLAVCSELLEHLPDGMDQDALFEVARVLKPGGTLLITVPALEGLRATSKLRNLGHDDPKGGEYHFRMGYTWEQIKGMIDRCPGLKAEKKRYTMFLFSELFMDLLKWVYTRKNSMTDHSDIASVGSSPLFRIYRFLFPLLYFFFLIEDMMLATFFKGHILIVKARLED